VSKKMSMEKNQEKNKKVSESSRQIPLDFKNTKIKTFKDFIIGKNQTLFESLNSFAQSMESLYYLWGETGSGKSHLLQAFINSISIDNKTAVIFKSAELMERKNVLLIEMFDYICIDNIEDIAENTILEEALFFWINETKQAKKKIILAGQISNKSPNWKLPDLRSRIQSGRTHELKSLDRKGVLLVFKKLAQEKGIVIDERVNGFLEKNCPMNLSFLHKLLGYLDEITLVERKQVTIPLLKKILKTKLVN